MKRKLALLILIILAVSVVLVACNDTETTKVEVRWSKETHVFHVSLADYYVDTNNNVSFAKYNDKGEIDNDKGEYRKDRAISVSEFSKDEVIPVTVYGTYTLTITPNTGTDRCVVTGTQVLYLKYLLESTVQGETVDLTKWQGEDWTELDQLKATNDEIATTNLVADNDSVILKSTTTTMAEFANQTQQPISSSTTVDGFYLGKAHRQITQYTVSTTYDFSGKKPVATVTKDGGTPYNVTLSGSAGNLIDANQILVYVRSLGKTPGSLKDNKTVLVFDPFTGSTLSASFGYSYEDKVILSDKVANKTLATTLNSVSITVGSNAFMMQDNVPQTVKEDVIKQGIDTLPRLTTVHFRVGYLSYQIDYANEANTADWANIWEGLTPKAEEPQE